MKLHEAIAKLLEDNNHSLTTTEIAEKLNSNKWYQKKDASLITSFQIHGRTKNYSHLFKRDGVVVALNINPPSIKKLSEREVEKKLDTKLYNSSVFSKYLINETYFKPAHLVDNLIPINKSGLYCISVNDVNTLPDFFKNILIERNHNILYIGIAKKCLNKRLLNQELRVKGHGTFIRSIGAVLGFRPEIGSLVDKRNKNNYTFSDQDNQKIIKWINENLSVNWVEFTGNFENVETALINSHNPLLNISKNKLFIPELRDFRTECIRIANSCHIS